MQIENVNLMIKQLNNRLRRFNSRRLLGVALVLIGLIGTVSASYWIYSNIVTITPSVYVVTLANPTMSSNTTILLSGNLTKNGVLTGGIVTLYNCTALGSAGPMSLITTLTSSDGTFAYSWHGFISGKQYWFIAGNQVLP